MESTTMILLCGNKSDLKREVEKSEGQELSKKEGLIFFECSSKIGHNIKNMFYSSLAELPDFKQYKELEKENIFFELIKENEENPELIN